MSAREFLDGTVIVIAVMSLIAGIEGAVPLFPRDRRQPGRRTANLGLMATTLLLNWGLAAAAGLLALAVPLRGPGLLAGAGLSPAGQLVAGIAVLDFSFGYLAHRAMHRWSPLWRVHRNGNLRLWQPLDGLLSTIWVTPNMHKVHHSRVAAETDTNYGNLFSLADRLLGTFTPGARAPSVRYGLDDDVARSHESCSRLLRLPFPAGRGGFAPLAAPAGRGRPRRRGRTVAVAIGVLALAPAAGALDGARIEALTGARGVLDAREGVFKVSVPRSDPAVTVAGVRMVPALGLTSWAAFQGRGSRVMVMGDLVLTEAQVAPVMDAALGSGLEVTALHNHFLGDHPRIMFMHVGGMGDETTLATAIGRVFAASAASREATPATAAIDPAKTSLDPAVIDGILGVNGAFAGGVYKVVIGRAARMHGQAIGGAMGVSTWAAFAGSDQQAVVDGDFAVREGELQGVLKALRAAGIEVVAIHNHMAMEEPRMLFLHFWGVGSTRALAGGLRRALAVLGR